MALIMNPLRSHVDNHFDAMQTTISYPDHLAHNGTTTTTIDHNDSSSPDSNIQSTKPKKSKKRYWYPQRDSLARRNRLQMGKEGSRRRQRWDNNHFHDHPLASLVVPDDDDRLLMHTQPPFRWVTDDEQVMSILLDDDMDNTVYHHHHHHHQYEPYSMHHHLPAPLTRSMRHDLKKTKIPEQLVYHYENQIIAYLDEQDVDLVMVLDIADRFTRWVVHIMCSYYNLVSFTDHDHHDHQGQLLYIQQHTSDSHVVPDRLFSDFLFRR
ncbi:hypothetical protein K492DRAFT_210365 [Lichtheimia hyalospora FSU 10163]|nr:hypothetical protein K492DRAFT_210365 [Lichtheimia hyalospora FSU 10163]